MSNIALIYWSGTGNTAAMAEAVAEGVQSKHAEVRCFNVSEISAQEAAAYEVLLLGCPAMGAEVLEEDEFEPFFTALEEHLAGKKVGLFGSYGWGDGAWMRDWEERVTAAGGSLLCDEGLIVNEAPDADGVARCRAFGVAAAELVV